MARLKALAFAGTLLLAASARADADAAKKAEKLQEQAFQHFAAKRYEEGIQDLKKAEAMYPVPAFLYNQAVAYEKWPGHCAEAVDTYRQYLAACKNCNLHLLAQDRLALVEMSCPGASSEKATLKNRLEIRAVTKKQRVEGWADIAGQQIALARRQAVLDALRRAIEVVAGVQIAALMTDESYSSIRDNQERFTQDVSQQIHSKTEGYVKSYHVIQEQQEGPLYKVLVEAEVNDTEVMRELALLARKLADARFPKIMFVVDERYTDRQGKTEPVRDPTLQALLEDELLARGFDLVAKERIAELRSQESQVFQEILTDDNKAAKFAMDYGAEYLVNAAAHVRHTSFNDLGQDEHHAHAELSLKAINASTAGIVASHKASGNSPPNCYNEADLRIRSVEHVAPKLVDALIKRIMESWDHDLSKGVRYSVKLYRVKSLKKQGLTFIDVLKRVPGVKDVKKLSYGGERLELEVFYPTSFDVSHLEAAILEAASREKVFGNIDVTYSKGRELNFTL